MKNRNNEISYVFLLLYPFVVYLSLYIACCYELGAFYTIKNLFHIKENLSSLTLNGRSLPILAFMSVIYVGIAFLIRESLSLTSSPDGFGSAGWLSPDVFTGKYSSKRFSDNRLFTQHTRMDISPGRHHRNMNTLIIGSPGSGKTRSYAKPNLMQMNSSYVVMDPKIAVF